MDAEKKQIYAISTYMKIQGLELVDLPISKPTYYSLIKGTRATYRHKIYALRKVFGLTEEELGKSIDLEKKILDKKRKKRKII